MEIKKLLITLSSGVLIMGGLAAGSAFATEGPPEKCPERDYNVIYGTGDDDDMEGTSGPDLIFGYGGRDRIEGGAGDDCIVGGDDRDNLKGESGDDVLIGDYAGGYEYGDGGRDRLNGGAGNDSLYGGERSDDLKGGSGNDRLFGESGYYDEADGQSGDDLCVAEEEKNCELDPD